MKPSLIDLLMDERPQFRHHRLSRAQAERFFRGCLALMFPHFAECPNTRASLLAMGRRVEADLIELLAAVEIQEEKALACQEALFGALPHVSQCLHGDAEFIFDGDPASESQDEVILAYPGFLAIAAYRVAHVLWEQDVPVVPRLISEYAHEKTGIDIHPGARIGCPFCIDHGTGIVIGETSEIGDRVKLYQGVTLGALSVNKKLANQRRHPHLENDVVVYASAVILGGETVVGEGSVVGGNVWLTKSVPPRSLVYHESQVRVRDGKDSDPIEFYI